MDYIPNIAVIGLGYVGLPLALTLSEQYHVFGYDVKRDLVENLRKGIQNIGIDSDYIMRQQRTNQLIFVDNTLALQQANTYIITVPTPVDEHNVPDLEALRAASTHVGQYLKKGDLVVYESTVYPGCTEEECIPILERVSGLVLNDDFWVGYSPERINPGDQHFTLKTIKKIVSGSNHIALEMVNNLYAKIIDVGVVPVSSIKVAEAAKVIENAQRDVNISFVNELALIFDRMGIDTTEVLEAAGTKWNFLPFRPGLVGGHCISVDPYYLAYKSEQLGYYPQVILSGRRVNSSIGQFIAQKTIKLLIAKSVVLKGARVLILGLAFKENCSDFRNTKVLDIYKELKDYQLDVDVIDPYVDVQQVRTQLNIDVKDWNSVDISTYEGVILAVPHESFLTINFKSLHEQGIVIFDVKSKLNMEDSDARL